MSSFSISLGPYATRRAEALARELAVGRVARADLPSVRRVHRLVVGVVELGLVQVEPDARALDALSLRRAVLGSDRAGRRGRGERSEKRPSCRAHGALLYRR